MALFEWPGRDVFERNDLERRCAVFCDCECNVPFFLLLETSIRASSLVGDV